jgi:hypothetical protein
MKLSVGDEVIYEDGYRLIKAEVIGIKRHWFKKDEYLIGWEEDGKKCVRSPSQDYLWPVSGDA